MNLSRTEWQMVAYVAPFLAYLFGTAAAGRLDGAGYAVAYTVVACGVAAICWMLRRRMVDLKPHLRMLPGIIVGLVGIAAWIFLSHLGWESAVADYLPPFLRPGSRPGFNPWQELPTEGAIAFIIIRSIGLVVLVPLAEELFWRGFLLRWWIDPEWYRVPVGAYSFGSCMMVTVLFTLAHPEWLAAATYCLLINGLLYWRKDLWQCVVAHAVSNAALICYVLSFDQWQLW